MLSPERILNNEWFVYVAINTPNVNEDLLNKRKRKRNEDFTENRKKSKTEHRLLQEITKNE
jgi:predicted DNA binding protein